MARNGFIRRLIAGLVRQRRVREVIGDLQVCLDLFAVDFGCTERRNSGCFGEPFYCTSDSDRCTEMGPLSPCMRILQLLRQPETGIGKGRNAQQTGRHPTKTVNKIHSQPRKIHGAKVNRPRSFVCPYQTISVISAPKKHLLVSEHSKHHLFRGVGSFCWCPI